MKMKKERDKSNAALIAQFEFFFTNGIIEQRFGDVWSIDYGKMLTAIAPDSAAVQLALASGDHYVSHTRTLIQLLVVVDLRALKPSIIALFTLVLVT